MTNTLDYERAMATMAQYLESEIRHARQTVGMEPLDWQADIELYRAMLRTMELHAKLWQDRLDHDAEADRQAAAEEIEHLTNGHA